jgi:hypothetical protein
MRLSALKILRPDLYEEAVVIFQESGTQIDKYTKVDDLYLIVDVDEMARWTAISNGHLGLHTLDHAMKILLNNGFEVTLKHPSNE